MKSYPPARLEVCSPLLDGHYKDGHIKPKEEGDSRNAVIMEGTSALVISRSFNETKCLRQ